LSQSVVSPYTIAQAATPASSCFAPALSKDLAGFEEMTVTSYPDLVKAIERVATRSLQPLLTI
jgi:hypothetical protein